MLRLTIRYISVLCCLLIARKGLANEMSVAQFETLERQVSVALKALSGNESVSELEGYLSEYQGDELVIALEQVLNLLAQSRAGEQERRSWVQQFVDDSRGVYTRYPEHPEQKIAFINIANSAKRTLALWDIAEHQQKIATNWQQRSWVWPSEMASDERQALINWFSTLDQVDLQNLAADFLLNASPELKTDNGILYALARHSGSTEVYALLWQQSADQYSYKALAELGASLDEENSVAQLKLATAKPELASQALLSLARSFSHNKQAQDALIKALEKDKLAWHAASAYKFIKSSDFKQEMKKRLTNREDKVSRFASKNLNEGAEQ